LLNKIASKYTVCSGVFDEFETRGVVPPQAMYAAVARGYGWDADISEEQVLEKLLGMNEKGQPHN
jgi:hypothetical protein